MPSSAGQPEAMPRAQATEETALPPTDGAVDVNVDTQPASRPWNDAPLRTKTGLLIILGVIGGVMLGIAESATGHAIWPLAVGLPMLIIALIGLSRVWACEPIEHLTERLEQAVRHERPVVPRNLPVHRRDDVGRLARSVERLAQSAVRDYHQVRHLRRSLESRVAAATAAATRQLRRMAMRDPLTDLGNRRFLDETLDELAQTCAAAGADLVCAAIDMDHFKKVNDEMGHAAGDQLLVFTADLIRASIRRDDCPVRVGGDEFIVLMPGCAVSHATDVFRRVLELFDQHARSHFPATARPSLSVGIASLKRERAASGHELLQRADALLYNAKRSGRGRIAGG